MRWWCGSFRRGQFGLSEKKTEQKVVTDFPQMSFIRRRVENLNRQIKINFFVSVFEKWAKLELY